MMIGGFDIEKLRQDAHYRWLKPSEVLYILQKHDEFGITPVTPTEPPSGSLLLFNRRIHRYFRKDGYAWQKKKDGRSIAEAHEHLKVGNVAALNCYYARGEQNPYFQRRCYWMLEQELEHIVLVHYREVYEGRCIYKSDTLPNTCFTEEDDLGNFNGKNRLCYTDFENNSRISSTTVGATSSIAHEAMDFEKGYAFFDIPQFHSQSNEGPQDPGGIHHRETSAESRFSRRDQNMHESKFDAHLENDHDFIIAAGNSTEVLIASETDGGCQQPCMALKNLSIFCNSYNDLGSQSTNFEHVGNILEIMDDGKPTFEHKEYLKIPTQETHLEANPNNIHSKQCDEVMSTAWKAALNSFEGVGDHAFMIREIFPQQAYCSKSTKVYIVGNFPILPTIEDLIAIFDDMEVPVNIIQAGVYCCFAPEHAPGKVKLSIVSGNRHSRSNVRDFEYLSDPESISESSETAIPVSSGELELLTRLAMLLLCGHNNELQRDPGSRIVSFGNSLEHEQWEKIIDAISAGKEALSHSMYRILQELVKDKLRHWLLSKCQDGDICSSLSKDEQCVLHMISGLGFVWALTPLLNCKVGINFRDSDGWSALHWAARFGREDMVSALLAAGASAGAVTDPTSQDSVGKTPASIASSYGHKGLSGYLSEVALTSHLSSLKIGETDESQKTAASEAERTLETALGKSTPVLTDATEDHLSLKESLAAVRNAAQVAARILSIFRSHSFRLRQERAALTSDEYGLIPMEYHALSAMVRQQNVSLLTDDQKYHDAALHIQKKFRGWKGKRSFLTLKKNVVKIQACVRGHQVRRKYRELLRSVNIIDKIILRWRRGRAGLRGFHLEPNQVDGDDEDDILKVFRKKKVDEALDKDFKRVLSMVGSADARKLYSRIVSRHLKTKEKQCAGSYTSSTMLDDNPLESLQFPPLSPSYFKPTFEWGNQ